ncbi:unnamed protein product (macronuclear) [Paramecium tetraurelia]|uniref:Uncharacterized protein n=1 Tax=Paramecium tetraurelia TaxID=5888 RepID=A0D0B1_PARTE|nr:uncharacterized protein GSPATT00012030001 [Paramecium tetraurelia]CAK76478.1 unnamed protein product [Paramecium tetraurelia]|eukprot:XP_001443875.1 hypothetical protein (macronuclear) [Paramecium tetraurelia strain d4-2]
MVYQADFTNQRNIWNQRLSRLNKSDQQKSRIIQKDFKGNCFMGMLWWMAVRKESAITRWRMCRTSKGWIVETMDISRRINNESKYIGSSEIIQITWSFLGKILFSYEDFSIKQDNHKYIKLAPNSRFKQMDDKRKYNKNLLQILSFHSMIEVKPVYSYADYEILLTKRW